MIKRMCCVHDNDQVMEHRVGVTTLAEPSVSLYLILPYYALDATNWSISTVAQWFGDRSRA